MTDLTTYLAGLREAADREAGTNYTTEYSGYDDMVALLNVAPKLLGALEAVLDVHRAIDALNVTHNAKREVCTGCGTDDGNWQVWPCPTVRAIATALEADGLTAYPLKGAGDR